MWQMASYWHWTTGDLEEKKIEIFIDKIIVKRQDRSKKRDATKRSKQRKELGQGSMLPSFPSSWGQQK